MPIQGSTIFDPNLPPELAAEQQAIARRRRIAEAMLQGQGVKTTAPGVPVSWTQGLASMVEAYMGHKGAKQADTDTAALGARYQTGLAAEVDRVAKLRQGAPATTENIVDEQADGGAGGPAQINVPAGPGNPRGAIQAGLMSQYAPVREAAKLDHRTYENEQTRAGDREARTADKLIALEARSQDARIATADRVAAAAEAANLRRELQAAQQAHAEQMRRDQERFQAEQGRYNREARRDDRAAADRRPLVVTDAAGNTRLVNNQGELVRDLGPVGKPSATHEKTVAAKAQMQKDLAAVIPNLEAISKDGGLLDQSTGSGAGALVDMGASFFGHATPGSIAVGKLKPMVDPILKLVPRFEGPQSDKDTASYKEAAGDLGNPAVPNARKKAAAKVILEIYRKRQGQFSTTDFESAGAGPYGGPERRAPADEPPPGAVRRKP